MAIEQMTPETERRWKRRLTVRIRPAKLEGGALSLGATIRVDTRLGLRNKQRLLSPKRELRRASRERVVGENGGAVEWGENDGVLENGLSDRCEFDLSFSVLRKVEGKDHKSENWEEMGSVGMKIEDFGKRNKMEITEKLPIKLQSGSGGVTLLSTLTVVVSVASEEDGGEPGGYPGDWRKAGLLKFLSFPRKNKVLGTSFYSDELTKRNSLPSLKNQPCGKRRGLLKRTGSLFSASWRNAELAVRRIKSLVSASRVKVEPVVKRMEWGDERGDDLNENVKWLVKEIVSRDGETVLKCNVGLASYDQRCAEVAGEGACSVIAAVVAHWLHLNKGSMPNRAELDKLMVEGALEWKKLCKNKDYRSGFPDKHFDIDTVVRAGIRPLGINQESSVVGFFSPEKFELLKEAVSVDGIWKVIETKAGVYIVSWNDHFCVLKVEEDVCYVIDSLGERLTEGGINGFILKFDESSVMKHTGQMMTEKEGGAESRPKETSSITGTEAEARCALEVVAPEDEEVKAEDEMIICRGRACCVEYFKRFLAAILVRQLEVNEEKGIVGSSDLHKRLQIEFQYTTCAKK